MQFTERCEEAIKTNNLHGFHREMQQQLDSYTNVDLGGSGAPGSEKDPGVVVLELKLKALILDCIHNIDVVEALEKNGVRDIIQWLWQKQLRYPTLYFQSPYFGDNWCIAYGVHKQILHGERQHSRYENGGC